MFESRYFVLAPNFHGATILSMLLNFNRSIVSLGDTYPSNLFDQVCGCGKLVSKCSFWKEVKSRVDCKRYENCSKILPIYPEILNKRIDKYIYNILNTNCLRKLIDDKRMLTFSNDYLSFEKAVFDKKSDGQATVFVDGVKSISRVKALISAGVKCDGIIHLVRDPGDFAKSSMKQFNGGLKTLIQSSLIWRFYHNRVKSLSKEVPYLQISYEHLCEKTDCNLSKAFNFLNVQPVGLMQLLKLNNNKWCFMGNSSVFNFNGELKRSVHTLTNLERTLVRSFSGMK